MPKSFVDEVREEIKKTLITEIEASDPKRASEIILNIIFKGKQAGLTEKDMNEIREIFKKKLKEMR